MNNLFISLVPDPPEGFIYKRPSKLELLSNNVSIFASNLQDIFSLMENFKERVIGVIVTEAEEYSNSMIGPNLYHITADKKTLNMLKDTTLLTLQIIKDKQKIYDENQKLKIELERNKKSLNKTQESYNDNTKRLAKLIENLRNENNARKLAEEKLSRNEKNLRITLHSIGDAVIATDQKGIITRMNPIAEKLTGWSYPETKGKKLSEIFNIISAETKKPIKNPVEKVLKSKKIVEMVKHTLLNSRQGHYYQIAHSAAPIIDENKNVTGVVLVFRNISEEYRIQEALRESEERYREFVEGTENLVTQVNSEGVFTYVNHASEVIFGQSPEEVLGLSAFNFVYEPDREKTRQWFEECNKNRIESASIENRQVNNKGVVRDMFWTVNFHYDQNNSLQYVNAIAKDITAIKRAKAILQHRSDFEEILFQSASLLINCGLKEWDKVLNEVLKNIGTFSELDRTYFANFSDSENRVVVTHEWCASNILPMKKQFDKVPLYRLSNFLKKLKNMGEIYYNKKNPLPRNWKNEINLFKKMNIKSLLALPIITEGNFIGWLGFDSMKNQVEWDKEYVRLLGILGAIIGAVLNREEHHKELRLSKMNAEKSDKLKSEFLAQVSHEIRTPVNTILSFANLIKDSLYEEASSEIRESFQLMNNAGRRITRTIDLIINMSEVQSGTYDFSPKNINIYEDIIKVLFPEYMHLAREKQLTAELILKTTNTSTFVDEYTVTQIIHNLLDNAIKYTDKGKVKLLVKRNRAKRLQVEVLDTGIGISNEYVPHIFDAFSQEEQGYTRKFEGNGLGLALVKNYCDLNKIDISVESKKDAGTSFRIVFPRLPKTNP